MAKMLGRLGWHGQCSCCNGPDWEKRDEEREWLREADAAVLDRGRSARSRTGTTAPHGRGAHLPAGIPSGDQR